ncbi:hypothetical protein GO495_06760 [Chitinophaga oryziterrae]|uniref:Tyrosine-type recombinase/integrase n=1 Tax=Chitinophaga oryziterrae TaxID=1031224 RepID=A0A6N8J7M7_9BACT|nr:phage integrase SAM-like domain-containing protein [Chitinophaga oryziterrae]MVT40276.1 hypothetical protein [Chitinophaga oryziterrae]
MIQLPNAHFGRLDIRFLKFLGHLINKVNWASFTVNNYKHFGKRWRAFERYTNHIYRTSQLTRDTLAAYKEFLKSERNYAPSSIKSDFRKLHAAITLSDKVGYNTCADHYFYRITDKEEPYTVYLNEFEILSLLKLKIDGAREHIRDQFVIGCYTALRFGDYSLLDEHNIIDDRFFTRRTNKTGERVLIPLHPVVKFILEKYDYRLPPSYSIQYFNRIIKLLAKAAGIKDPIFIEKLKGNDVIRRFAPKWSLIGTHTARRSGATNMYLAGIPVGRIMLLTGHLTETAFFRYIKIDKIENALYLEKHSFFQPRYDLYKILHSDSLELDSSLLLAEKEESLLAEMVHVG